MLGLSFALPPVPPSGVPGAAPLRQGPSRGRRIKIVKNASCVCSSRWASPFSKASQAGLVPIGSLLDPGLSLEDHAAFVSVVRNASSCKVVHVASKGDMPIRMALNLSTALAMWRGSMCAVGMNVEAEWLAKGNPYICESHKVGLLFPA